MSGLGFEERVREKPSRLVPRSLAESSVCLPSPLCCVNLSRKLTFQHLSGSMSSCRACQVWAGCGMGSRSLTAPHTDLLAPSLVGVSSHLHLYATHPCKCSAHFFQGCADVQVCYSGH